MIKLGDKVKDIITGYEGVVTAMTDWLHGCTTCGVLAQELKDGKPIESAWFDIGRLEIIPEKVETHTENHKDPGGPQVNPTKLTKGC